MKNLFLIFMLCAITAFFWSCSEDTTPLPADALSLEDDVQVDLFKHSQYKFDIAEVVTFQPAGEYGGGVLEPGTLFPPKKLGRSKLYRGEDRLSYKLVTTGLPEGAYTNWWAIINNPEECEGDCDEADIFENPATEASVFWATGNVVKNNGVGRFKSSIEVGEIHDGPDQHIMGPGLLNPETAEVWIIVKYHGLASDDPDELYLQTHTLTGLCESDANAHDLGPPFGVQCFDPQIAMHMPND